MPRQLLNDDTITTPTRSLTRPTTHPPPSNYVSISLQAVAMEQDLIPTERICVSPDQQVKRNQTWPSMNIHVLAPKTHHQPQLRHPSAHSPHLTELQHKKKSLKIIESQSISSKYTIYRDLQNQAFRAGPRFRRQRFPRVVAPDTICSCINGANSSPDSS